MSRNWEELIGMRDEFVGRDVEVHESGLSWRGPFKDLRIEEGTVILETSWSAELHYDGTFSTMVDRGFGVNRIAASTEWGSWSQCDERISFSVPMVGRAYILAPGEGVLDQERLAVVQPVAPSS